MEDFTNLKENIYKTYNGANGKKRCLEFNGKWQMVKFPQVAKQNEEMTYANGVISEHLGSSIFSLLEVQSQKTTLGTFRTNGNEKIVVACEDFEKDGWLLRDFASLRNSVVSSGKNDYGMELESILHTISAQIWISTDKLELFFWKMFVIDALLGNFNRHNGNWGFLCSEEKMEAKIAPIFACGSCLLPQADEKTMNLVLHDEDKLL